MTNPMEIAQAIKKAVDDSKVKDTPITVSFVGGEKSDNAMAWLVENGIPAYGAPDLAVNAMAALHEYAVLHAKKADFTFKSNPKARKTALEVISKARADGRDSLTEIEAKEVFSAYGLLVTNTVLAKTEDEAVALAKKVGFRWL
jgi:acetyltransferase